MKVSRPKKRSTAVVGGAQTSAANKRKSARDFDIALSDIVGVLRRRLALILASLTVSICLAAAYYVWLPKKYESSAEVLVERRDLQIATDGVAGTSAADVSRELMATHMRVVQSKRNIQAAVDSVGLDKLPSIAAKLDFNISPIDYVADNLYATTGGDGAARDAHVINLRFRHSVPEECQTVLTAIVSQYQQFLREKYQDVNSEAAKLINAARVEMERELSELDEKYREFRSSAPVLVTGEETSNVYEQRYAEIQAEISEVDSRIAEASTRLQLVRDGIARSTKQGDSELERLTLIDAVNAERMSILLAIDRGEAESASFQAEQPERMASANSEYTSLLEKRARLNSLQAIMGANHPEVVSLRGEVSLAEEFIRTRTSQRGLPEEKPALTPEMVMRAYVSLLHNDLQSLQDRKSALLVLATETEAKVKGLVDMELTGEYLVHERLRKQTLYDSTLDTLRTINLSSGAGSGFIHEVIELPELGKVVEPNFLTAAAIALFGTVVLGAAFVGLAELADRSVHNPDELENIYGARVISHVPELLRDAETRQLVRVSQKGGSKLFGTIVTHFAPQSRVAEVFRGLRTQMLFSTNQDIRVIGITSAHSGEGKSTVAANIACSMAQTGRQVLLVDCDMRRPQVKQLFGLDARCGLADLLNGVLDLSEAICHSEVANLALLHAGNTTTNPAELLGSQNFADFLAKAKELFEFIVLDCPPALLVSDPAIVAPRTDGMLVVVKVGGETKPQAARVSQLLKGVSANILGIVVNRSSLLAGRYTYAAYGYEGYESGGEYFTANKPVRAVDVQLTN